MRQHALIFDFGNVFAYFDYTKACDTIGRHRGITGAALLNELRQAGLNDWVSLYESGRMNSAEFVANLRRTSQTDLSFEDFAAAWRDIFQLNEPLVDMVSQLHQLGYPLVLGSNTNELHAEHFKAQFAEELKPFQALILSYQVGHMKPDERFYLACADAAGRLPKHCVFIDDLKANVQGAIDAGLSGVHYRDDVQLVVDLRQLGIPVEHSHLDRSS